jgi:hypothetical protein
LQIQLFCQEISDDKANVDEIYSSESGVTIPAFGVWMVLIYDKLSGPLQYE